MNCILKPKSPCWENDWSCSNTFEPYKRECKGRKLDENWNCVSFQTFYNQLEFKFWNFATEILSFLSSLLKGIYSKYLYRQLHQFWKLLSLWKYHHTLFLFRKQMDFIQWFQSIAGAISYSVVIVIEFQPKIDGSFTKWKVPFSVKKNIGWCSGSIGNLIWKLNGHQVRCNSFHFSNKHTTHLSCTIVYVHCRNTCRVCCVMKQRRGFKKGVSEFPSHWIQFW